MIWLVIYFMGFVATVLYGYKGLDFEVGVILFLVWELKYERFFSFCLVNFPSNLFEHPPRFEALFFM